MACEADKHEPMYVRGTKVELLLDVPKPDTGRIYACVCIVCHSVYIENPETELDATFDSGDLHG